MEARPATPTTNPMKQRIQRQVFASARWALAALALGSCGAGTAGIVAGSNGSGGGTTPALEVFGVENPKISPCRLRLDASQAVRVGLFYDLGAGELPMTLRPGPRVTGNEVELSASEETIEWDFESDLATTGYQPGVRLVVKRGGALVSGGELTLGMGNDAPVIESAIPPAVAEVAGITAVRLRVSDSSGDPPPRQASWVAL